MEKGRRAILERLHRAAKFVEEQLGCHPAFISLYGSQNYDLDVHTQEYDSDFDYKCIVMPDLKDLVYQNAPISKVLEYEGGQIDVKDIRVYTTTMCKMNPAYLEQFFTYNCLALPSYKMTFYQIREEVKAMVRQQGALFVKAAKGMYLEKKKAMCHPYPTIAEKIEKYGYDGKQVHHMYRLLLMLRRFNKTGEYILNDWTKEERDLLLDLKLNKYPLDMAEKMVARWDIELDDLETKLLDKYEVICPNVKYTIWDIVHKAIYNDIVESLDGTLIP